MNSWKYAVVCMGLSGALVALPGQAHAMPTGYLKHDHSEKHDKAKMHESFWTKLEDKLALRKEQREELKKHREAIREERKELKEEGEDLRKQIKEALRAGADQSTLDSLGQKLGKNHVMRMEMSHRYEKKFYEILDDDQKSKLDKLMTDHRDKWKKNHDNGDS